MTACELCGASGSLNTVEDVALCEVCGPGVLDPKSAPERHWTCLRNAIWSDRSPVKIQCYRILKRLGDDPLALELLDQVYLDEADLATAESGLGSASDDEDGDGAPTVDSNGTALAEGDTVTLIKDLEVKGANFTAKRGTTVKGINLTGDPRYVEGKVNGIRIVLVAAYLKKA